MKTISVIRLFIIYMLAACTISCNSNVPSLEEPKDTAPHLNESDSLAMVNIYKKIGPWGYDWDLKDIQTWGGVDIALETSTNQYRIVGFNYYGSFSGEFPDDFRKLTELRVLGLGGGTLSGQIPSWIGELTNLIYLYIGFNQISGPIPPEIGKLTNLEQLTIGNNFVNGPLPEELGNLANLQKLVICDTKVSGSIPKSLGKLDKIKNIVFHNNQLSGEFPIEILKYGVYIGCWNNNITKLSFDAWKDEPRISPPDLQGNRLSGELPEWVFNTKNWHSLKFHVSKQQEGYGYTNYKED
ncbi:leucine-rich repeat domain-containing protein [Bacteroides sp. L10-4]|uniref:leucine-rich repeat domain-containing protein n=1 Tax=Bacteroides sp. L10-4 TaxID=2746063 RepID=UPI0015956988|nr:leucine-rich repeat domain-containing protein [Bacteroides sp. L10-4]NVK93616.1 hypothetical protein [Bacteroides sp. L10-4]